MTIKNLPETYQPFARLTVGTNTFVNTQALVSVGGFAPILIGKGEVPRVWLYVPAAQPGASWLGLIADNVASLPSLSVAAHPRLVKVSMDGVALLNATVGEAGALALHKLDLRPLGLNVYFDDKGLQIFDSTLTAGNWIGTPVAAVFP